MRIVSFFVILLIIVTGFIFFSKKEPYAILQTPKTTLTKPPYLICEEGQTKKTGFNVYTCIDAKWIYTGQIDDNKG